MKMFEFVFAKEHNDVVVYKSIPDHLLVFRGNPNLLLAFSLNNALSNRVGLKSNRTQMNSGID